MTTNNKKQGYKEISYWNKELLAYDFNEFFNAFPNVHSLKKEKGRDQHSITIHKELTNKLENITQSSKGKHIVLTSTLFAMVQRCAALNDVLMFSPYFKTSEKDNKKSVFPIRINNFDQDSFKSLLGRVKDKMLFANEMNGSFMDFSLLDGQSTLNRVSQLGIVSEPLQNINDLIEEDIDIIFCFSTKNDELQITVDYKSNIFDSDVIKKITSLYMQVLENILQNTSSGINEIEITSEAERAFLLKDLDFTDVSFPEDESILSIFQKQVKTYPDKIALKYNEIEISYKELDQKSNQVANLLIANGTKNEDLVCFLTDRSHLTVIGILGILKTGAAYVPIDIIYPEDRQKYIVENCKASTILTVDKNFTSETCKVIAINNSLEFSAEHTSPKIDPNSLCYVIYTSGTTGYPKGVMVTHRNVVRLLFNEASYFSFTQDDVWVMFHSPCFDMSVWEIFGSLLYGAKLIVIPKELSIDSQSFIKLLKKEKVTILNQTPSALNNLIYHDLLAPENLDVRLVTLGGEAFYPHKIKEWRKIRKGITIVNMYGITETTVHNSYKKITQEDIDSTLSNVGKPLPTLSMLILDQNKKLVPSGMIGELYVGGEGITKGYLGKEELTKERFIKNPYNSSETIYKSGDLVRRLDDGNLAYIGRIDHQVQLRGFRIELREIETNLTAMNQIKDAVVLLNDNRASPHLVAFYIADKEIETSLIKSHLEDFLMDYMIPSNFIHVNEIPINNNGKTDRKKLFEIEKNQNQEKVLPNGALENALADTWRELLGTNIEIGRNEDFFSLGGNSISVVLLKHKISQLFNVELSISQLFENGMLSDLADLVEASEENTISSIPKAKEKEYYALSPSQQRLFFIQQLDKSSTLYNMPSISKIKGELGVEKLQEAVNNLISRYEILRTSFQIVDKEPVQIVHKKGTCKLELFKAETQEELTQIVSDFRRPFDFEKLPLIRVGVIKATSENILLFDIHHIISDGFSQTTLINELIRLYQGETLEVPRLQYKDYVEWYYNQDNTHIKDKQKQFWLSKFSELPPVVELPSDYKPLVKSYKGHTQSFELSDEINQKIVALAKENKISVYMVLLGIFKLFISKASNQKDIVVGTISSGRTNPDLEGMLGVFVNTLPIRSQIDGENSFQDFLHDIKKGVTEALDHQEYPIEDLINELNLARTSKNPLFEYCFVYDQKEDYSSNDFSFENFDTEYQLSKFDLSLVVGNFNDSLRFAFEYSTEVFSKKNIEMFIAIFQEICVQVFQDSNQKLNEIALIREEEKTQIIESLDLSEYAPKHDLNVVEIIKNNAKKHPEKVALTFKDENITYGTLETESSKLANYLLRNDIKKGDIVGIYLDRSPRIISTILGILKVGATYLPIDTESPEQIVQNMLIDSKAKMVLTESNFSKPSLNETKVVFLDQLNWDIYESEAPEIIISPESIAYIIYTSGTTGKPKGVQVRHENLMNMFFNEKSHFDFHKEDVWVLFHRYCFDFSVWEIFGALVSGARLLIVTKEITLDPTMFLALIEKENVTVLNQTPTAFNGLVKVDLGLKAKPLNQVRYVIFGGEKLNASNLIEISKKYEALSFINMYGITETTIHVTHKELKPQEIMAATNSVGLPIPGYYAYVLDEDLQLLPEGIPGELFVGGKGVTSGYIGDQELTNTKFITDPYREGEIIYKTGDEVKLINGELEYIGRIDNQVQIKGFRIELGSIETVLRNNRFIDEVKIVVKEKDEVKYLVAYYVADKEIDVVYLRRLVSKSLPNYMIPSQFVHVTEFKTNSNGKVDLTKLPEPTFESNGEYVAPTNEMEQKIAQIWASCIGIEKVGIDDNYFVIGGDSILAVRVISMINEIISARLNVVDLYNYQTIRDLVGYINSIDSSQINFIYKEVASEIAEFQTNYLAKNNDPNIEAVYPMSNIEKAMSYIQLRNKEDIIYYEQLLWNLAYENFDLEVLKKALDQIVAKQSSLRTALDLSEDAHIIYKTIDYNIPYKDLSKLPQEIQKELIMEDMKYNRENCFDIDVPPLWKLSIYKLGVDHHAILFEIHHCISDGWSIATFTTELNNTYKELLTNPDYQVKPLMSGFKEFITEEMVYDKQPEGLDFWKRELTGFKKIDFDTVTNGEGEFKSKRIPFDDDYYDQLELLANKRKTPIKNIFFAAYIQALNMMTFENDLVTSLVTFNRLIGEDGADVFGNFLNTVPVRFKFEKNYTCKDLLDAIDDKLNTIKNYDRTSLFNVARTLGINDVSQNPITDLLFNFTSFHVAYELSLEQNANEIDKVEVKDFIRGHGQFDVNINGVKNNCFIHYDYITSFISDEKFEKFRSIFMRILSFFVSNYESELTLHNLFPEEYKLLTEAFNKNELQVPSESSVITEFEKQVSLAPESIALITNGKEVTYEELNQVATKVAKYITKLGITESFIPISIDRSVNLIATILGVWKSGNAIVPINKSYPESRINYIIEDTKAVLIFLSSKNLFLKDRLNDIEIINIEDVIAQEELNVELPKRTGKELGYVIYTSGTTGRPKGVLIDHPSLLNCIKGANGFMEVDNTLRVLGVTPLIFDISLLEISLPLIEGGTLLLLNDEEIEEPKVLIERINKMKPNLIQTTPSRYKLMLSSGWKNENNARIMSGGEPITKGLADKLKDISDKVWNLYGPTEATIWCTVKDMKQEEQVSIGSPWSNTQIYIVNEKNELQPKGIVGEILVGGIQVARGYLNREKLNEEKFIDNPFIEDQYKLYKTGDLGYWKDNGEIIFLNRKDDQVKVRGYRIELGEIESQITSYEPIKETAVVVKNVQNDNKIIVAYYVAEKNVDERDLKAYLKTKIPDYMLPSIFAKIDEIPLTINGKLDKRQLPEVSDDKGADFQDPTTENEFKVRQIWTEVLNVEAEQISVSASFFDIGGHSLNANVMVNKLNKAFELELSLREIFAKNSIKEIAEHIDMQTWLKKKNKEGVKKIEL
nr:hypothetical protein BACY1_00450 [Tenacibaculum mesophilum]